MGASPFCHIASARAEEDETTHEQLLSQDEDTLGLLIAPKLFISHEDVGLGEENEAQVPPQHRQADGKRHRCVEGQAAVEWGIRVVGGEPQHTLLLSSFVHELHICPCRHKQGKKCNVSA